jgi:hypothetical protein
MLAALYGSSLHGPTHDIAGRHTSGLPPRRGAPLLEWRDEI